MSANALSFFKASLLYVSKSASWLNSTLTHGLLLWLFLGSSLAHAQGFLSVVSRCQNNSTINETCVNDPDHLLSNITFGPQANVKGGKLTGTIVNQGWLANVTILPGTTVSGGTLTGYVDNQGTVSNITFRGATLTGGKLAGTIVNQGVLKDVTILPDAIVKGGQLVGTIANQGTLQDVRTSYAQMVTIKGGTIAGKLTSPYEYRAQLEEATVAANAVLTNVKLGKNVKMGAEAEVKVDPTLVGSRVNEIRYAKSQEETTSTGQDKFLIGNYELVKKEQLSATQYQYQYKAQLSNSENVALPKVSYILSSLPEKVTVIDGVLSFENVPVGGKVGSQDTFTIVWDGIDSPDLTALVWAKKTEGTGNIKDMAYVPHNETTYILYEGGMVDVYVKGKVTETISLPELSNPQGLGLDDAENLYIADTGNHRIVVKANRNTPKDDDLFLLFPNGMFGKPGIGLGEFKSPEDVAIGKINGKMAIFVADTGNHRIQRLNQAGVFEMAFDGSDSPEGVLKTPRSLTISAGDAVAVVDSGAGLIRVFDMSGKYQKSFGTLNNPSKITQNFITEDYIVADTGNHRVQIFYANGEFKQEVIDLNPAPVVATFYYDQFGEQLLVAPVTGDVSLLKVVDVSQQDPPGATPIEVVKKFVAAVVAQDLQTAKTFLADKNKLAVYEQDSVLLAKVVQRAQSIVEYGLAQKQMNLGYVLGFTGTGDTIEFALQRNASSGVWEISSF